MTHKYVLLYQVSIFGHSCFSYVVLLYYLLVFKSFLKPLITCYLLVSSKFK